MPQKFRPVPIAVQTAKARPVQDVVIANQQAKQFPSVGMTLRSYQYDPKDYHKRPAGRGVVVNNSRWRRFRQKITRKRVALVTGALILIIGGFLLGKFLYNAHKLFGGNIFGIFTTTKLRGEDKGRVNILLAGNSADDPGHSGGNLTDSIMLISIDTRHHKAFLLSLPRDLWVHIPDDGHHKLNNAYVEGQASGFRQSGYPDGGMGQLEQIVSQDLGIDINYYALINYNALKQAVDAVGGVNINVQSSDPRGLYDPNIDWVTHGPLVKLSNGKHHLNGEQALDLARARGDSYYSYGFPASDFDRTAHQRQLMVALKQRAVSVGVLANPSKLSKLFDAIGRNVKTDFKLGEVRRLYDITKPISGNNVKSLSLNQVDGKSLLKSYAAPDGESALIPAAGLDDYSDIQAFIRRLTSSNSVVQESAKVVVLNSTASNGLATKVKKQLVADGMEVTAVGDSPTPDLAATLVINKSSGKKPATAALLAKLFGNHLTTANTYGLTYNADFIVILGDDQASKSPSAR